MELNRNQYFFIGLVLLMLGLQFRTVTSFVLTEEATRFLAERTQSSEDAVLALASDAGIAPKKTVETPNWLGWCLMSIGCVLSLHSLAMNKPGG